jgi:streptogramin lyase
MALARLVVLGCLVIALAGCSSDDGDDPDESAPPSSPESSATTPPEVTPPPAEPVAFDRTIAIPEGARPGDESGGPDWMAVGFGSLWVKRDNNAVERISPDGKRLATIDADIFQEPVCQGIGVTDTAVWACASTDKLIRIDPGDNGFSVISVPKLNEQGRLTFAEGLLWVLNGDGDVLQGLAEDGRVERKIDLGTFCTDTADTAPDGVLWVVCSYKGVVLRVDLRSGEVTGQVPDLPHAASVAVSGDVWVGDDEGLVRIDEQELIPLSITPLEVTNLRSTDDGVVLRESTEGFVSRVDAESGEISARLSSPDVTSGGDVIEIDGRWWVTSFEDNLLVRLRSLQPRA